MPTLLGRLDAPLEAAAAAGPLVAGPQIYQSIGVEPVINCRGTFTIIGGSVERPEVRAAMDAAVEALRSDRRTRGRGRPPFRRADRGRVGHGLGRLRRRVEARHGRLRHRRQSGKAHSHPGSVRSRQDRSHRPAFVAKRLRPRDSQRRRQDGDRRVDRRARTRHQSADGDDLPDGRQRAQCDARAGGTRSPGRRTFPSSSMRRPKC